MSAGKFFLRCLCVCLCWSGWAQAAQSRKYVLSIGITAYRSSPLRGCVNDATGLRDLLVGSFGFDRQGATLLTNEAATRAGILRALMTYAAQVQAGDLFVFFYSGHGTLHPDALSPEADETETLDLSWLRAQKINIPDGRYDSAIVPIDSDGGSNERPWGNLILDDELFAVFTQMTGKGATVILLSDSCHSGSLARSMDLADTPKFLNPELALGKSLTALPKSYAAAKAAPRDLQGRYLALTSSQDNQVSIDRTIEGTPQGVFTFVLRKLIERGGAGLSYETLSAESRALVHEATKGVQTPSLNTRYFKGSLAQPLFSLTAAAATVAPVAAPAPAATAAGAVSVRVFVRGRGGEPLAQSLTALFKPHVTSPPSNATMNELYALLKVNENGEGLSQPLPLRTGEYLIKTTCVGYVTFTGRVKLTERNGVINLFVVLDPER